MQQFLLPAVLWIAFIETARAALTVWDAASVAAGKYGSAPLHVCVSLALWACAFFWLLAAASCVRLGRAIPHP